MKSRTAVIAFDALSHGTRLKIFKELVKVYKNGITASQLCEQMDMPPATLSFHMSKLISGDLVDTTKKGRSVTYFANPECVTEIMEFLMEKCYVDPGHEQPRIHTNSKNS